MASPRPDGYRAYLLRLWAATETTGGWRASLEDPHTGERQAFASLNELMAFLEAQAGANEAEDKAAERT